MKVYRVRRSAALGVVVGAVLRVLLSPLLIAGLALGCLVTFTGCPSVPVDVCYEHPKYGKV